MALMTEELGSSVGIRKGKELTFNVNVTEERVSTELKLSYEPPCNNSSEFSTGLQKRKKPISGDSWLSLGIGTYSPENKKEEQEEEEEGMGFASWTIRKRLKKSDIDGSSRLLLGKASVESLVIPMLDPVRAGEIETKAGTRIAVWDVEKKSEHELILKRWNSTGSFVLINNWKKEFVNRRELKQGEEIELSWDHQDTSRLNFRILGRGPLN